MINQEKFKDIASKIHESALKMLHNLSNDMEKKIHKILKKQFKRMNLVDKEEFNIQTKILLQTREELKKLKIQLNTIENTLNKI